MTPKTKICKGCGRQPIENFGKQAAGKYGRRSRCGPCVSIYNKQKHAAKMEKEIRETTPNLRTWQPRKDSKFDAYLGSVKCMLSPFTCVKNEIGRVIAESDGRYWQLDKSVFCFLEI